MKREHGPATKMRCALIHELGHFQFAVKECPPEHLSFVVKLSAWQEKWNSV